MGEQITVKHVYQAINAVTSAMATEGLGKNRKNDQQGYRFRGIDDVYNVLSRHLAVQKLCILPYVQDRQILERATKNGGLSTYTILTIDFHFVSAVDGSEHVIRTIGEAMDTADKSTNKAMSAAMKYACLLAFQIPTEGDNDADASHPEKASGNGGGNGKPAPSKADSDTAEEQLTKAFTLAATTDDVAKVEASAAKAVQAGLLTDAARSRLRKVRAETIGRLAPQGAA